MFEKKIAISYPRLLKSLTADIVFIYKIIYKYKIQQAHNQQSINNDNVKDSLELNTDQLV